MALHALHCGVRSCQRELRHRVVVEERGRPVRRGVALIAGLRESAADVRRVRSALEGRQVAAHALRRRSGKVAAGVALRALHGDVRARQRKCRLVVIETCVEPAGRIVALLASLREAAGHMVGIGGALEVRQVAAHALRWRAGEVAAPMALRALHSRVRSGQRECSLVVIERRRQPRFGVMTTGAILRESRRPVIWICGRVESRQMASYAAGGRGGEFVVRVTLRAVQPGVRAGEGEAGEFRMIELRSHPSLHGVALLAVGGEIERRVAGVVGFLKVCGMARDTFGGEAGELAVGGLLVARITAEGGVRPEKREAVLVLLDVVDRNLPTFGRMALLAPRSQLSTMDIGVAVRARVANVGEDQFRVTLRA